MAHQGQSLFALGLGLLCVANALPPFAYSASPVVVVALQPNFEYVRCVSASLSSHILHERVVDLMCIRNMCQHG